MKKIFYPQNMVVVGVSSRPDNLAKYIVANLRAFDYSGELHAVGRQADEVFGVPIVDSLESVPDNLDLAVILTPAEMVPSLMEICGRKGIRRVVVESGGFSEFSNEGRKLEQQLLEIGRNYDMKIVGPNCISVVNLESGVCLPFGPISPELCKLGSASIISQSGGISLTFMGMLCLAGVGVNKVISIGNKADLDETDYLDYFLHDEGTEMVCLYLESLENGRRLIELASSTQKPVIIHKGNRGQASQKVAFSHTAALANDDRIVDAAFRQAGILRAENFRDLVAIAKGLSLPPVTGSNLLIISRSGGHAVVAADESEQYAFELTPLPESFVEAVEALFRADVISLTNPLDLGAIFDFEIYARIVEESLRVLAPDAILLINTYSEEEAAGARRLAEGVGKIIRELNLPIAFCVYSDMEDLGDIQERIGYPVFDDLGEALRGLAASRDWHAFPSRGRPLWTEDSPCSEREETKQPGPNTEEMDLTEALSICQQYGIPVAPWETAFTPKEVVQKAIKLGLPVALKALSPSLTHKSDSGGVLLNLNDTKELERNATDLLNRLALQSSAPTPPFLIQKMVEGDVEIILGGKRDPSFGPVLVFGLGGIYVEIFDDVAFRVAPIERHDAIEMIESIRGAQILHGSRGRLPINLETVIEALLSISTLLIENPNLLEIEINPMILSQESAFAVDARAVKISNPLHN